MPECRCHPQVINAEQYQLTTESGFKESFSESNSSGEMQSESDEESSSAHGFRAKDHDSGFR
jgi:hypothetical protein